MYHACRPSRRTTDLPSVPRLGDETRLRIVALLAHGELCVCHLQDALELPQPTVSRQLAILRAAGLVADRREGTWVYYRLVRQENPECERQLRGLVTATRRTVRCAATSSAW
jgi:ArsR family transcriptional regulator